MFFDFSIDQKVEWEIEKKYVETDLSLWLIVDLIDWDHFYQIKTIHIFFDRNTL